jgi:hypothetical protein
MAKALERAASDVVSPDDRATVNRYELHSAITANGPSELPDLLQRKAVNGREVASFQGHRHIHRAQALDMTIRGSFDTE